MTQRKTNHTAAQVTNLSASHNMIGINAEKLSASLDKIKAATDCLTLIAQTPHMNEHKDALMLISAELDRACKSLNYELANSDIPF